MKPKYEKPIAVPLGEAAKGSGACNVGSGVGPLVGSGSVTVCGTGYNTIPIGDCENGGTTDRSCSIGSEIIIAP
jgi:hypothetical protein